MASEMVHSPGAEIETYVAGQGPALVILPSYGRGSGEDFEDITAHAIHAGWRVLRPQPRGVAGSAGPMTGITLHDLAEDVAGVIRALGGGSAVLLGHAFGHAVAGLVATKHPEMVKAVVFAASQASKVPPDIAEAPFIAGDLTKPESERLAVLRKALFAPGHDGRQWLAGWHSDTLRMQREAAAAVPRSDYMGCGTAMVLEVFGAADPFKPKECWHELRETLGGRVETVVIENASHALFPEQPRAIATAILPFLARL